MRSWIVWKCFHSRHLSVPAHQVITVITPFLFRSSHLRRTCLLYTSFSPLHPTLRSVHAVGGTNQNLYISSKSVYIEGRFEACHPGVFVYLLAQVFPAFLCVFGRLDHHLALYGQIHLEPVSYTHLKRQCFFKGTIDRLCRLPG